MDEWMLVTAQTFGGAFLGGFLGPYLLSRSERRRMRAVIRDQLMIVEDMRWPPPSEEEPDSTEFERAARKLGTESMVGGIPYSVVHEYVAMAIAFRDYQDKSSPNEGADAGGRRLLITVTPKEFAETTRNAARLFALYLRSPVSTRITLPLRMRWLRRQITETSNHAYVNRLILHARKKIELM